MTRRQKRMAAVLALVTGVGLAAVLGFTALRQNMMYFYTPSDLLAGKLPAGASLELGGLVEKGSLQRGEGLDVSFSMADCTQHVPVRYSGILPDLFREGQGVIATGHMGPDGTFVATRILAKHDENYMPPQVAKSLTTADGKHSCAPFKSVYQPVQTSGTREKLKDGTGDWGTGTGEQPSGVPQAEIALRTSGTAGATAEIKPDRASPPVPSPQSLVPASP